MSTMLKVLHAPQVFQDQILNAPAIRVTVQLQGGALSINLVHKPGGPEAVMQGNDSQQIGNSFANK